LYADFSLSNGGGMRRQKGLSEGVPSQGSNLGDSVVSQWAPRTMDRSVGCQKDAGVKS